MTVIALEGVDGSGKSTLAKNLTPLLEHMTGRRWVTLHNPTDAGIEHPKSYDWDGWVKAHNILYDKVQGCLDNGVDVLLDRWYYSMAVYQTPYFERIPRLQQLPNLYIFLPYSPKGALAKGENLGKLSTLAYMYSVLARTETCASGDILTAKYHELNSPSLLVARIRERL